LGKTNRTVPIVLGDMGKKLNKKIIYNAIKIAVSVVLVVILYFSIDLNYVVGEIIRMAAWFLLAVLGLAIIGMILEVVKWRVLLSGYSYRLLAKAFLYSQFFILALPGALFGEAAKIAVFGKDTDSYDRSVSTVAIDKMTGLIGLMIFGVAGLLLTREELPPAFMGIVIFFLVFAILVISSMRIPVIRGGFLKLIEFLRAKMKRFDKFYDNAAGVVTTWNEYLYKPSLLVKSVAFGLLFNAVLLGQYVLVCWYYGIPAAWVDLAWMIPLVGVVQALPISLAGIGIRDVSMVAMFAYIGVTAEQAMILALCLLIVIIFRAVCGAAVILWDVARK